MIQRAVGSDLLSVRDLTKVFRSRSRGDVRALDGVSFGVPANDVVGLLGPNGAGKTTTIKSICGLVTPTSGSVSIDGVDVGEDPRGAARLLAAVLEGNRTVYWRLSVRENLEYFAALRGLARSAVKGRIEELIERFGLHDKAGTPAMQLSRGMQQKLALACAVLPGTPLLLLDEPTLGLDVETSIELRAYVRQLAAEDGRTVLLSSHDMRVVQDVCQRVVVINGGRVVADDHVDNLLALFRVRAFRVTVGQALPDQLEAELRAAFDVVEVLDTGRLQISVALRQAEDFYTLTDVLRSGGATIEAVESAVPDLEQVFLALVNQGVTQGATQGVTQGVTHPSHGASQEARR